MISVLLLVAVLFLYATGNDCIRARRVFWGCPSMRSRYRCFFTATTTALVTTFGVTSSCEIESKFF